MSLHALEMMHLLTLHPAPRAAVLAASVAPHRSGVAVLLHAAGTGHAGPPFYGLADPEVGLLAFDQGIASFFCRCGCDCGCGCCALRRLAVFVC
jgi:hypothetical protein